MKQLTKQRYTPPTLEALRLNQLSLLATASLDAVNFDDLYPHDEEWQDL